MHVPATLQGVKWGGVLELELASHQNSLHLIRSPLRPCSVSPPSTFLSPPFPGTLLKRSETPHGQNYPVFTWGGDFLFKPATLHACATTYDNAFMKAMIMQLGLCGVWRRFFWKLGGWGKLACCFVAQSEGRHGERRGRAWDGEIKSANTVGAREGGWWGEWSVYESPPPVRPQVSLKTALLQSAYSYSWILSFKTDHKHCTICNISANSSQL